MVNRVHTAAEDAHAFTENDLHSKNLKRGANQRQPMNCRMTVGGRYDCLVGMTCMLAKMQIHLSVCSWWKRTWNATNRASPFGWLTSPLLAKKREIRQ
jgi:hypothetical protein